jgi:putative PIN family toxin of toxin-antitoxin system
MRSRPRVTLDTNVLLSALVFGGKPRQIIELFARDLIDVVISEEILTEMRRHVANKFAAFSDDLRKFEILLEQDAELVKLGDITIAVCRDPDDDRILETATIGACDYIVSGDKDLLVLEKYKHIQILKPAEFLDTFGALS